MVTARSTMAFPDNEMELSMSTCSWPEGSSQQHTVRSRSSTIMPAGPAGPSAATLPARRGVIQILLWRMGSAGARVRYRRAKLGFAQSQTPTYLNQQFPGELGRAWARPYCVQCGRPTSRGCEGRFLRPSGNAAWLTRVLFCGKDRGCMLLPGHGGVQ